MLVLELCVFHILSIMFAYFIKRVNFFSIDIKESRDRFTFYRNIYYASVFLLVLLFLNFFIARVVLGYILIGKYTSYFYYFILLFLLDLMLIGTSRSSLYYENNLKLYYLRKIYTPFRISITAACLSLTILTYLMSNAYAPLYMIVENKYFESTDVNIFNHYYLVVDEYTMKVYERDFLIYKKYIKTQNISLTGFSYYGYAKDGDIDNFIYRKIDTVFISRSPVDKTHYGIAAYKNKDEFCFKGIHNHNEADVFNFCLK